MRNDLNYSTTQHKWQSAKKSLTIQGGMLEGRGKNWRPIDINIDRSSPSDTLAQLVERGASNAKVPGSNPGWSVIFSLTVIYVVW